MKKQINNLFLALVFFIPFHHISSSSEDKLVEDSDIDTILYHASMRKNNQNRKTASMVTTPPRPC
jgi:hypothetical protein